MFCRSVIFRKQFNVKYKWFRTFLSDEYKCTSEWQSRLSAPFMQKIKLDTFYYDIDQVIQHQGKPSAIDIDLFANKITPSDDGNFDELNILLHKLRLTEETTDALDSTGHALIRNYTDAGNIQDILTILDNRLDYGVFLDHYIASYILDYLIKNNDYKSGAHIASQLMLQEDFDNELSKVLSLYATYKYLENPVPFYPEEEKQDSETKKDEVKVRVKFIRNEFFDDHFDLRNNFHIVGKTLIAIGKKLENNLAVSIKFLGYIYYSKYDKCLEILKLSENQLHKEVIQKASDHLSTLTGENDSSNEKLSSLKAILEKTMTSNKLVEANFESEIEKLVKELVAKTESVEIEKQKKIYLDWNTLRETKLNQEIQRLDRAKRLKRIEKITQDMDQEEQKLWFFENEDKIDLQIDSKKVYYPKRWLGKKKKPRVVDEDYVPPEIVKHRN